MGRQSVQKSATTVGRSGLAGDCPLNLSTPAAVSLNPAKHLEDKDHGIQMLGAKMAETENLKVLLLRCLCRITSLGGLPAAKPRIDETHVERHPC